jgi:hypothetical protein
VPRISTPRGRHGGSTSSTTRATFGCAARYETSWTGRSPGRRCRSRTGSGALWSL